MDTKELAKRYGMSEQGVRRIIRKHLGKLNIDGEHVSRTVRGWQFDDVAIRRLDELRKYSATTIEVVSEPTCEPANETISNLQTENRRLLQLLCASQQEVIRLQKELLKMRETNETKSRRSFVERIMEKLFRRSDETNDK